MQIKLLRIIWAKAAQQGLNDLLGVQRVIALHALLDESLQLLVPLDSGV